MALPPITNPLFALRLAASWLLIFAAGTCLVFSVNLSFPLLYIPFRLLRIGVERYHSNTPNSITRLFIILSVGLIISLLTAGAVLIFSGTWNHPLFTIAFAFLAALGLLLIYKDCLILTGRIPAEPSPGDTTKIQAQG